MHICYFVVVVFVIGWIVANNWMDQDWQGHRWELNFNTYACIFIFASIASAAENVLVLLMSFYMLIQLCQVP